MLLAMRRLPNEDFGPAVPSQGPAPPGFDAGDGIGGAASRRIIEHIPATVAVFDTDMRYLAASGGFLSDYRLPAETPASLIGRSHYEVFPEIPERWRQVHRRVLAGETLSSDGESFPRADGRTDWLQWTMTPWHRPDGSIGGAILVSAFITARREAAEALRVSEQRYRTALKGPSITVFEQDLGLRYTWIDNPALGARAQPVIGRTDFDLFDDAADAANLTALKRQVLDSGTGLRQEVQIRHQGSEHIFDLSVEPLRDAEGATIGVSCAAVDITERKRIEAALAESEARYRALATATLEGISIHDGERTVEVNDACWRMFGYTSREEAIGQPPIEVIVPTSRADVLGKVASQHDAPYETVGLRRDGTTFPMQVHGRTVLYQGRPMRVAVVRDLSQQQAAEAALRKSEARYRVLTEAGAHMTWALRPDSVLVFANRSWRDFTGLEADEIPLDAMMALAHPEDRARVQAETADALARGAAMEARFRMRRRDGAYRWILRRAEPVRDAAGSLVEWIGFSLDIHDAYEAEEDQRRLKQLVECSPDFIGTADTTGRVTYLNPGGRRMIGLDPDADIGALHFSDYVAPGSQARFRDEVIPTARDAGMWEGDLQLVNLRTGALVDVHRIALALRDPAGRLTGYATVTRDVTMENRAATAKAESEARLRLATESAGIGTWEFDLATGRAVRSSQHAAIFGDDAATAPWNIKTFIDHVLPEDRPLVEQVRGDALATCSDWRFECRIRRASDGEVRWIEVRGAPVRELSGVVSRYLGVVIDVTERKEIEAVRERLADEMERRVAERTRALTEAGRALQAEMRRREEAQASVLQAQKLEALGQLTGGVAHDFNNVLAAILGSFELLAARVTDEKVRRFITSGEQAARRAEALVKQLLAFARREQLRPVLIEPADLLQEIASLIRHAAGPRVAYAPEVAQGTWPILADVRQLEVALLNLTVNARDAMPDGGRITISTRNAPADAPRPAGLEAGDYVVLRVRDTGTGMPAAVLARATEPFFTTKEAGRGTGLGLAMVHGFAVQSSGALCIESVPGQGTQVEIWLPRAAAQKSEAIAAESAPIPACTATPLCWWWTTMTRSPGNRRLPARARL